MYEIRVISESVSVTQESHFMHSEVLLSNQKEKSSCKEDTKQIFMVHSIEEKMETHYRNHESVKTAARIFNTNHQDCDLPPIR